MTMDTFKSIIDKISEGLNFFDFSFFVSGFVTYITLLYFSKEFFAITIDYTSVIGVLVSIVLSYVCGVISFSLGKWIRSMILWIFKWNILKKWKNRSFDEIYKESQESFSAFSAACEIFDCKLKIPCLYKNVDKAANFNRFSYSSMWIEIRKLDEKGVYYKPLYRQWVMQAICEGLVFSFMLIMVLSISVLLVKKYMPLYACSSILAFVAFAASCHEARRYAENQIKEVIISYYFLKNMKKKSCHNI